MTSLEGNFQKEFLLKHPNQVLEQIYHKISWERPHYIQDSSIPFVPLEKELDTLNAF